MSWLFSRALVAEYSAASCLDGEPSVLSSGESTPQAYCAPDKTTAFSRLSRFGMTFKPLTESLGAELLMSYLAGFHAKTSALPERAQVSLANDQACGPTWRGSLAKFDPDSHSWKTAQLSLLGDSELCSVTWPRSGMTQGGECWELPMLERRTIGTDSGLSGVPTPLMTDWKNGLQREDFGMNLPTFAKQWPTPQAHKTTRSGKLANVDGTPWDGIHKPYSATTGRQVTSALADAVAMWPTPIARDCRTVRGGARTVNSLGTEPLITQVAIAEGVTDGALNPDWVEWLMGWPLGWTDLKPLATAKCLSAQPLRSPNSQDVLTEELA